MEEDYFTSMRTVGVTLDENIANLQEVWKMPNLLLCKSNEEDQVAAKKLVDNLRNEMRQLKEAIEQERATIARLKETHTQFLEESTLAIKSLKDEVDEIKVLFLECGYVEDPAETNLSLLTSQLESLSFNGSVPLTSDGFNDTESPMCQDTTYDSPSVTSRETIDPQTPSYASVGNVQKISLAGERPIEPTYSPYYYKMMKK